MRMCAGPITSLGRRDPFLTTIKQLTKTLKREIPPRALARQLVLQAPALEDLGERHATRGAEVVADEAAQTAIGR